MAASGLVDENSGGGFCLTYQDVSQLAKGVARGLGFVRKVHVGLSGFVENRVGMLNCNQ